MASRKPKKNGNEPTTVIVLITAILTLLSNIITLIMKLIELLNF